MRKSVIALSLLASVAAGPSFAQDKATSIGISNIEFTMEALYLSRSALPNTLLGHDSFPGTDVTTDGISSALSSASGARFGFSGDITGPWGFDAEAFFSGPFDRSGAYNAGPFDDLDMQYSSAQTPGNLTFDNAESADYLTSKESSFVGGGELSATYDLGGVKLLFGPRSIYYSSSLSTYVADDTGALAGGPGNDYIDITSKNFLLGGQVGIEGMYQANQTFSFGGRASVGVYANMASLDRNYRADDTGSTPFFTTQTISSTTTATGMAESLEISPKVAIAIAPKLDLTFGGTLLMLNGVDEPGTHYAGIGAPGGGGGLAADPPSFHNGVNFAGVSVGLKGHF